MSLRTDIAEYYFSRLSDLPTDKQFHIGNRLLAWSGDARARTLLQKLQQKMVPQPPTHENIQMLFAHLAAFVPPHTISGYAMRKPYFAAYPRLTGIHNALLRMRHLRYVYGIDARTAFANVVPTDELHQLENSLANDPEALRTLSTYAINTMYLFHIVILQDNDIDVQSLYDLGQSGYDVNDPEQLRLLIYLYTHCVIAASNFYIQELPANHLPIYRRMMEHLETQIDRHFAEVSLDTKIEFWVCCRVAHCNTKLADRIEEECSTSLSQEGTFLVDTHNIFAKLQAKSSFVDSEHRNTLFVLSGSDYRPHSTLQ